MRNTRKKNVLGLQVRLILLIIISTITVVIGGFWSFHSFRQIEKVSFEYEDFTRKTNELKSGLSERHLLLTELRKADSSEEFDRLSFKIKGIEQTIMPLINGLPKIQDALYSSLELNRYVESYQAGISGYIDTLKSGNKASADRIASTSLSPDFAKIFQSIAGYQSAYRKQIIQENATLEAKINSIRFWSFLVVMFSLFIVGLIPYILFGNKIRLISRINRVLDRLRSGEIARIDVAETTDEIGQLASGINQVSENLNKAASFANDVGQGKFDTEFNVSGERDVLGAALVEMRDRLKAVALDESQRNWAIAGYAQISEILSSNTDLQTFADAIIARLTQYIGANQGGFFIAHENVDENSSTKVELVMLSAYAYDRKKYISKTFQLGEGLVGQAALEKGTLYLKDIPVNYMTITSGLGEAVPACLLVVPLIANNEMYGVLEFASFQSLEKYKIEFIERLAENIAVTLTSVRNNERNLRLLRESQQMAQQLTANEEEMRQNMEELAATQEEMKRVQIELAGQVSAMNNAAIVSEADIKGDIIFVNDEFCRIAKFNRDELIGKNHRILKSGHQEQSIFDDLWKTISRGQVWSGVIKNRAKDGTYYWVSSTITPILNAERKPVKYVGVRFDITAQVAQQEQIKQALEESQSKEEEIRQNSEELIATQEEMKRVQIELAGQVSAMNNAAIVSEADIKGDIIFVNDEFCRIAKYSREELIGHNHRMLKSGHQEQSIFDDLWRTISRGLVWKGVIKNRAKDGTFYWVSSTITPILDINGKPTKYVGVRFDITAQVEQQEQIRQALEESQSQEEEIRQNAEELISTQEEMQRINTEMQNNLSAINKALCVVEFDMKGYIIKANNNFLQLMGYDFTEVEGKHHSLFVEAEYRDTQEYLDFWTSLRKGESFDQEFTRINSAGKLVYIRGYYFPILNKEGHPYKVMKFAIDITKTKEQELLIQQTLEETKAQEEEIRQNAEELLSTQEEMRRVQTELDGQISALNNAAIVSEADIQGNIIFVNEEFCRIAKYSKEELIGNNHRMLKSGHQAQSIFDELWQTISKGKVWKGVIKNRAKDGTFYWVASTITPILDVDGKPVKYVGVRFDITAQVAQQEQIQVALEESKAQEEEIRQNAEELLSTQEEMRRVQIELDGQISALNNAAIVSEADIQGDIIFANEEFCRISKYTKEELIGNNHRMLKSGHQDQNIFDDLWHTISRGKVWKGIIKNRAKDGTYYWVSSTITPILNMEGKPIKYVGVRFDITTQIEQSEQVRITLEETQAQEEEIRQTAEELLATQEDMKRVQVELNGQVAALNNAAIVSEADIKGDIIFVNDEFCRIAKYSRIELLGQNHRLLKSGHQPDIIFEDLWRTISRGMVWRGVIKNKAKDGTFYWVASTITPIMGMEGKPIKYVAVRFDITDQVSQSEQVKSTLVKAQSLEEESRQREESLKKHVEELTQAYRELSEKSKSGNGTFDVGALKGEIDKINDSTGYVELNQEGFVTAVSSLMLNLLGYESYDLIGLHLKDVVQHDNNGLMQFVESKDGSVGLQYQSNLTWKTKSGNRIELPVSLNKLTDKAGGIAKIITLVQLQNRK